LTGIPWSKYTHFPTKRIIGRRTFIVNALSLGITPNIVMKWTGHSDYKAMKPYIDIVDSIKASSMTKFDGLI
jgi:hypothetical protein